MKVLYPEIEPYAVHSLKVEKPHQIYVEECGNPLGMPVIYLHGGPASGCKSDHRRFFNPEVYRIVLFDQRGCGRSKPYGELTENTTQHLLQDIERIRIMLGINHWLLFGGSWGATLALLYAQAYPDKVSAMILRGVFLARQADLDWFVGGGVNRIYPERWQALLDVLSKEGSSSVVAEVDGMLAGVDELAQLRAAREWSLWGGQVALGQQFDLSDAEMHIGMDTVRQVKIEIQYAKNRYFIKENQILNDCKKIEKLPVIIIHGRNDLVCPVEAAYSLHQKLPNAEFIVLPHGGHVARGDEMIDAMVNAVERIPVLVDT